MEDEIIHSEEEEKRKAELARLQQGFYLRIGAVILFLALGALAIRSNGPGFLYFLKVGSPPMDLGNARKVVAAGKRYLDLPSNSYVKVRGLIVTRPASTKIYNFFFSPLLNLVVRTKLPLDRPKLRVSQYVVPEGLLFLLEDRKVMPEDFTTNFSAEGRLVKLKDYSGWSGGLENFYGKALKGQEGHAYIIFDGDTPWSHAWDAVALVSVLLGLILADWSAIRKRGQIVQMRKQMKT